LEIAARTPQTAIVSESTRRKLILGTLRALSGPTSLAFMVLAVAGVGATLYLDAVMPASVPRGVAASQLALRPLLVTILVFAGVGFLIVRRQGQNAVGWILLGAAASLSITGVLADYTINAEYSTAGTYPLPGVASLVGNPTFAIAAWLTIGLLPLLFPDGRPLTRRWLWVVRFGVAALLVWQVTRAFDPAGTAPVPNPIGIPAAAGVLDTVGMLAVAAVIATIVPGIIPVALRYRRGTTETRLQLRRFLAASVGMLLVTLVPILRLSDIATNSVMAGGVDALGGSLSVVAAPGRGVRVEAALPSFAPVQIS
jgi:hypothetical protein